MEKRVCLLLIINFYIFLFQNVNCSSGTIFIGGRVAVLRKKRKNKKQNKLFCFHHHHRPTRRHCDVNLQERGKKSRFFIESAYYR